MTLTPRFFAPIGTLRQPDRLNFLTRDVRSAGTVLGFFAAAAALGAEPGELALLVVRRHSPADLHRQVVLVFHKDPGFADGLARLYRAHSRPLGVEAQKRWCAVPEPSFLADETFALLAARFPNLLVIEEDDGGAKRVGVYASAGFKEHPKLKLAPLAVAATANVTPLPPRSAPQSVRPSAMQDQGARMPRPAPVVSLRPRRLRSTVALNEVVERRVVDQFRRLLVTVAAYS